MLIAKQYNWNCEWNVKPDSYIKVTKVLLGVERKKVMFDTE